MTTLFNLFCPFMTSSISLSIIGFGYFVLFCAFVIMTLLGLISSSKINQTSAFSLFPSLSGFSIFVISGFILISSGNFFSLVCYSFPLTTTLGFNFSMALMLWLISILLTLSKSRSVSSFLPSNSPWYLIPFLSLVEFVSVSVRPITLCFRLLANMSAGHILLSLICKMSSGLWLLGILFGVLELMVAMVQAFVFTMLVTVYLEESINH